MITQEPPCQIRLWMRIWCELLPLLEDGIQVTYNISGDSLSPAVRESLFPTDPSEVKGHPEWKRPTIFGLL